MMNAKLTPYSPDEVFDTILAFNSETSYDKLLDILVNKMMKLTNSDAGTLYILEDNQLRFSILKNRSLGISTSMGDSTFMPSIPLKESNIDNASAYAAIKRRVVIIDDVYTDTRFNFMGPRHYDKISGYRTKSMLVLPIISYGKNEQKLVGVLQLINAKNRETGELTNYDNIDISVFTAISKIAASILSNTLHIQELRQFDLLIAVTTQAIDERSAYSKNHTQNVSNYCREFAGYLNMRFGQGDKYYFSDLEIDALTLAALLHDIGKIITPLNIMDKSSRLGTEIDFVNFRFQLRAQQIKIDFLEGRLSQVEYETQKKLWDDTLAFVNSINTSHPLTPEEYDQAINLPSLSYTTPSGITAPVLTPDNLEALAIRLGNLTRAEQATVREHVSITNRLLEKVTFIPEYRKVPLWAANHHELLDGTGYPRGLNGDDLDVGTRILTIVDIFDALIATDRPYKKGLPIDKSLQILEDMAEKGKLDKDLVALFAESKVWEKLAAQKENLNMGEHPM